MLTKESLKEKYGFSLFLPKTLNKRFPELYKLLGIEYPNLPIREAFYLYEHNLKEHERPKCLYKECDNFTQFGTIFTGYHKYCSKECSGKCQERLKLIEQTTFERFGVKTVSQSPQIKDIIKKNNLEKYGKEHTFQLDSVKSKIEQTNLEKYGTKRASMNESVKDKMVQTSKERYGQNYENQVKKRKQTNWERYGIDSKSKLPEIKKIISLKISKNNTRYSKEAKEKRKRTMLERYGVEHFCLHKDFKIHKESKPNKKFERLLNENGISYEREFRVENFKGDFKVENTIIEINPSGTHNTIYNPYGSEPIDKNYHLRKSQTYLRNGYRCIHVFDWDDFNLIINLIKPKQIIYARKCTIKELTKNECDNFLIGNHLQGTVRGQTIKLGLFYNSELVQVMTFGKPRYNKNYDFELLRLCTHKDYRIVGGSQKLFNHFIKNWDGSVISYCDDSKFSGEVYSKLGFKLLRQNPPTKHWCKCYRSKNPTHFTDNFIRQKGFDNIFGTDFGKGSNNDELMKMHKFVSVYDCGQSTYIFENLK